MDSRLRSWWLFALKALAGFLVCVLAFLVLVIVDTSRDLGGDFQGGRFARRGAYYVTAHPDMVAQRFEAVKPPRTYRAFLLGGSQMMGSPYVSNLQNSISFLFGWLRIPSAGGIATWLQDYLGVVFPGRRIEVINAAMGSSCITDSVETLKEILAVGEPDLIVVMDGNPERTLSYHGTASEEKSLASTYQDAIEEVVRSARRAKVRTYLLTVPANLRDWAPKGGTSPVGRAAGDLIDRGHFDEALRLLSQDGRGPNAEREYLLARCYDGEGRFALAKLHYLRARDLDPSIWRPRTAWNEIVRREANGPYVELIDMESAVEAAAADGIPGRDLFHDATHLNLRGNQIVAKVIARHIADHVPGADASASLESLHLEGLPPGQLRVLYLLKALQWLRFSVYSGIGGDSLNDQRVAADYFRYYLEIKTQINLRTGEYSGGIPRPPDAAASRPLAMSPRDGR